MRLFICTEKQDSALLDALTDVLAGYRMSIDVDRIIPSRDSRPALQAAIQDCDAFVFMVTGNTLQSARCYWEFEQAVQHNRPIVIAVYDDEDKPLPAAFEPHLLVDMCTAEAAEQLLDALYVVGATPPSVLAQLLRNRLRFAILVLLGVALALVLAGPFSPYREQVSGTVLSVLQIANRTGADLPEVRATQSSEQQAALAPLLQMTVAADADALLRQGQELARAGNVNEALAVFNRVLELVPNSVGAYIARGDVLLRIGERDTAWGDYTRAIELAPDLALTHQSRAAFYIAVSAPDGALQDIDAALRIDPNDARSHNLRGQALILKEDYENAVIALNRALELRPDYAEALAHRGNAHRLRGEEKLARADYDLALTYNPMQWRAHVGRGLLYNATANPSAALEDFTQAININPDATTARFERGRIYLNEGEFELAFADLSRVVALQADDPRAYLLRGSASRCMQQPALAVADFSRAADIDLDRTVRYLSTSASYRCGRQETQLAPRLGDTDHNLDGAYLYISSRLAARAADYAQNGDLVTAAADYNVAISLNPLYTEVASLYYTRGRMYEAANDIASAIQDYEAAIDIVPERADFWLDYGRMLILQGDRQAGFRALNRAITLNPSSVETYIALGDWHIAEGQPEAALTNYTRGTYINQQDPRARFLRAQTLLTLGRCTVASVELGILREQVPDDARLVALEAAFVSQCTESVS